MNTDVLAKAMTEQELDIEIQHAARQLNLLCYHVWISVRSRPGFPDLVIAGPHGHVFRELKSETGKLTPAQIHWLTVLNTAPYPGFLAVAGVWRPRDWMAGVVAKELAYLALGVAP